MATYNKFQSFVGALGLGYHGNLNTNLLKIALFRSTDPPVVGDDVLADLTAQVTGTGYTAGGEDTTNIYSEAAGTGTMTGTKVVWTATAADWLSFRYVILYNTQTTIITNGLIGWWDYLSDLVLGNGETFTVKFNGGDPTGTILTIA
jgi:hypothetical protein